MDLERCKAIQNCVCLCLANKVDGPFIGTSYAINLNRTWQVVIMFKHCQLSSSFMQIYPSLRDHTILKKHISVGKLQKVCIKKVEAIKLFMTN